jgi:hypothetical protein
VAPALSTPATLAFHAALITNQAYAPAAAEIARLHTLTGVPTQVATVEQICAAAPGGCSQTNHCADAPKAIKDWLIAQRQTGLKQVVLVGDNQIVPSRQTTDHFSNAIYGVTYDETFFSDYYYSDLTNWDTNGDCLYGDPLHDSPSYLPTLGVTRISVSSAAELAAYVAKETAYLTAYDTSRLNAALFMSNVATDVTIPVVDVTMPIDAGLYFQAPGRTLSLVPSAFNVTRLYSSLKWPGAQPLTVATEQAEFQKGSNLVVHSGHGAEEDLTVEQDGSNEFTGDMAYQLQNTQYPVLLSCACDAATFDDGDACAGQRFITAPHGGGVGYLGNSTIGLGIAGGMQMIDGMLKAAFASHGPLIGEALLAGHANLPRSDAITINNVPVVGSVSLSVIDAASWRWTQKAATYLGDGLLPLYTDPTLSAAPRFTAKRTALGDFSQITLTPQGAVTGALAVQVGDAVYTALLSGNGQPVTLTVAGGGPQQVAYGFNSASTLSAYQGLAPLP